MTKSERNWLPAVALAVLTAAAYSNTFDVPFRFDDPESITDNPTIRRLWPSWAMFAPPPDATVTGRPVANATFAFNYAVSGLAPWSYHAINLGIHIAAGLVLFGIVRRTLRNRASLRATSVAFTAAAAWLLHPVQTESVTYVVQRVESLCGLFYLLTLYGFIRARAHDFPLRSAEGADGGARAPRIGAAWQWTSLAACALGMATKEVMVTAPVVVLLYDRTFIAGTLASAWRSRRTYYLGLASTWGLLAALVATTRGRAGTAGFATGVSVPNYALTQLDALSGYLARTLWPSGLIFDYGSEVVHTAGDVLPEAVILACLLAATSWALARQPSDRGAAVARAAGFLGAACFLILAPTTSVVPIATQTIAEHRMYLPLAAASIGIAWGLHASARGAHGVSILMATALAFLTWQRNELYRDDLRLWSDTAAKRPNNERAHYNTAVALAKAGRPAAAAKHYARAVELAPDYVEAHHHLGIVLAKLGRFDEAIRHVTEAARLDQRDAEMRNAVGLVLTQAGRPHDAVTHHRTALQLRPGYARAHAGLASALAQCDRVAEALPEFEAALKADPSDAEILGDFGGALLQAGETTAAISRLEQALAMNGSLVAARSNLGFALLQTGRLQEAAQHYFALLRLEPDDATAHSNLGFIALRQGDAANAVKHYDAAARLRPDEPVAHYNHAQALMRTGDFPTAETALLIALRLRPSYAEAHQQLQEVRRRLRR